MTRWQRITAVVAGLLLLTAAVGGTLYALHGTELSEATFREPRALWLLLALPWLLYRDTLGRDPRLPRLRLGTVAPLRVGPRGIRSWLRDLPGVTRAAAFLLFVLALARPVNLAAPEEAEQQGIDIVVVLDLSGSMRAALENLPRPLKRYVPPKRVRGLLPTRLDGAKAVIRDFIGRRKTDRIGVVVFGKQAWVLCPPTLDYKLLDKLVGSMSVELIDNSGTAIGDAVGVAVARMRHSKARSKAVILLTDGDSNAGQIEPTYAARLAQKVGVKVYTIQIGSGDMAKLPQRGAFGQIMYVPVNFPTNPELLKQLAKDTGGSFYMASDAARLQASFHDVLNQLEKTKLEAIQAEFLDLYRLFLLPAVLLLALDALLRAWLLRRFP